MKVLLTVASLLPSYGGPAFSVSGLATALAEAGAEVALWAPDQSAASTPLLPSTSQVKRMTGTEIEALRSFGRPDIIHDNGIWLPHNHRLAVLAARYEISRVVSVRGMLEPWALRYKRVKKRLAWSLFQRRDLRRAFLHHATAESEAHNVKSLRLGIPIVTIPNGVALPDDLHIGTRQQTRRKTALFMSRIHPKKGLPILIEAWAQVRPEGWVLQIAGPDEGGHQKEIERAIRTAGLAEVVSFSGPLHGRMKTAAYLQANLFVLPTHSENFGIVVAEALAHGVPVLTTTGAPWPELSNRGCGWSVAPTVEGIAHGLRQATSLDLHKLLAMGAKGRTFVSAEFCWNRIARLMLSAYRELLISTPAANRQACRTSLS